MLLRVFLMQELIVHVFECKKFFCNLKMGEISRKKF